MRRISIVLMVILITLLFITGCGPTPPPVTVTQFQDDFEDTSDYPLGPFQFNYPNYWDHVAGDHSYWSIVGGVTGHALQCQVPDGGYQGAMVNFSTSTSNSKQTIKADLKADHFSTYSQYRLLNKYNGALPYPTYYALAMIGTREISILKFDSNGAYWNISAPAPVDFDIDFSTSTVYTITLKFSGSTITGTVSGGGYTKTVKAYNNAYLEGHMGLEVYGGSDGTGIPYTCIFDNIKVTLP